MNNAAYIEKYIGVIIAITLGVINSTVFYNNKLFTGAVYTDVCFYTSIGFFGFLLTILAIIIQSDTETIKSIRENKKILYLRLIEFNKKTVILSGIVFVVGLILKFLYILNFFGSSLFQEICIDILILFSTWTFIDTVIFLRIVFKLLKD